MRTGTFHVITPLARFHNIPKLVETLRPHNIQWHVITDANKTESQQSLFSESWIRHYVCPNNQVVFWDRCNYAMNWFMDTTELHDTDFYCFLNDDDAYEPEYFDKLDTVIQQQTTDISVVLTSMKRGYRIPSTAAPTRRHAPTTLYAVPESIHVGGIGLEQIAVRGRVLKQGHRFPLHHAGDGMFICDVSSKHPTALAPDIFVWFNYFEPERWDV